MIEVSLHIHKTLLELLNYHSVVFNDAFIMLAKRTIHTRVKPSVSSSSQSISFWIPQTNSDNWFVGALAIRHVLRDYYAALLLGRFATGDAKEFLLMEKKAQEIYAGSSVDKILEDLIYNTAYRDLSHEPILLSIDDSEKPV